MRRWMTAPVVFAAAAVLAVVGDPRPARAQNKPVEENFTTADGVRLKGLFHKSGTPTDGNPVVVLMYPPGAGNSLDKPGDWSGLAATLNKEGYHVFRFDWRGHGKSTDISDPQTFWNVNGKNPYTGFWNQRHVAGFNRKPIKDTLSVKTDVRAQYFPMYVNDLAAVRYHLDGKNDQGEVNTSSIYLIGAGDAATLGLLWMTGEWKRPATYPNIVQLNGAPRYEFVPQAIFGNFTEAGADVAGAVWLSATRAPTMSSRAVDNLIALSPKVRENPMLFLHGEKEPARQGADSKYFFDEVLVAKGNARLGVKQLELTYNTAVPNTKLSGTALLGNNQMLGTEDLILKYLKALQKDRATVVRKERKFADPYAVDLRGFGLVP